MSKTRENHHNSSRSSIAISSVTVAGFKSISEEQTLEIRPLTLLAGSNSSGKSSMMQPVLLLKQTLEAQYDPGPLLLNGPNAKFTSARQFLSMTNSRGIPRRFSLSISTSVGASNTVGFRWIGKKIDLEYNTYCYKEDSIKLTEDTSSKDLENYLRMIDNNANIIEGFFVDFGKPVVSVARDRCFFEARLSTGQDRPPTFTFKLPKPGDNVSQLIQEIIHLPGLRGNPERTYPVTAIGPRFPGTFESYVASLIARWGLESPSKLQELGDDLSHLGLTWKVEAKPVDDTQVEIRVGRLKRPKQGGAHDLVNVADVGFGVSQTLPVVVALRAANPGQLVYIEQPEIHLHPRAQVAMAQLFANAANRGVRVVVETHSALLLLAVQALVAEGSLQPASVKLNWFLRNESDGNTRIQPADLDEAGRFGDWPEDFADVALDAEHRYLSAAEARLSEG